MYASIIIVKQTDNVVFSFLDDKIRQGPRLKVRFVLWRNYLILVIDATVVDSKEEIWHFQFQIGGKQIPREFSWVELSTLWDRRKEL